MTEEQAIRRAALEFRRVVELADKNGWPNPPRDFPKGACGIASEALGHYLRAKLSIRPIYVHAQDFVTTIGSHAWLEYKDLIIDVTADQFEGQDQPPVLITRDHTWHDRFGQAEYKPFSTDKNWVTTYCSPILSLFGLCPALE